MESYGNTKFAHCVSIKTQEGNAQELCKILSLEGWKMTPL